MKIAAGQSSVISLPDSRGAPAAASRILETAVSASDVRAAACLRPRLLVGIFIGISSLPQSVVPALADLAGVDRGGYNLAQVEPFDEDVL